MQKKASRTNPRDVRIAVLQRKHHLEKAEKCIQLFALIAAAKQRFPLFRRMTDLFTAASALQKTNNLLINQRRLQQKGCCLSNNPFLCGYLAIKAASH